MTTPDAMPLPWTSSLRTTTAGKTPTAPHILDIENFLEFQIGPERRAADTIHRSHRFAVMMLSALPAGTPNANVVKKVALAMLTEPIDVTSWHHAIIKPNGRISYDGDRVLITIEEMDKPLPHPEEKPGLLSGWVGPGPQH